MGKFKRLTKIHHDSGTDDSEQADDRDSSAVPNAFTAAEAEDKAVHSHFQLRHHHLVGLHVGRVAW